MDNRSNDKKQNRSGFSGNRGSGGNRSSGSSPRAGFDRKGAGKRFARPNEKAVRPSEERRNERATPARTAALTALSDVLDRGAYVSEAINRQLSQSTFPQNDRKFCQSHSHTVSGIFSENQFSMTMDDSTPFADIISSGNISDKFRCREFTFGRCKNFRRIGKKRQISVLTELQQTGFFFF